MKIALTMRFLAILIGMAALAGSPARAQSEIDPDHFDSPNTEPFEKPKTDAGSRAGAVLYEGRFIPPYSVQCNGNRLPPGEYSVLLHTLGKVAQATLNQRVRAITIPGIIRKQAYKHPTGAFLGELDGRTHRLSALHVGELNLLFDPAAQMGSPSDRKPKRLDWLPVTVAALKE